MKWIICLLVTSAIATGVIAKSIPVAENADEAAPIYGVKIPVGYREWKMIAVKQLHTPDKGDQLRAQLGNDIAVKAIKEGTLPYPDGSIIVALHWSRALSEPAPKLLPVHSRAINLSLLDRD
jgi:hypothetical protein